MRLNAGVLLEELAFDSEKQAQNKGRDDGDDLIREVVKVEVAHGRPFA